MVELRKQYQEHLARVHEVAGIPDGASKAARIFELERKIAKVHAPRVDTESVEKGNNHWKRSEFATRAPGLDWDAFFAAAGLDRQLEFVVWQPAAIAGISALVRSEPLATWKEWLTLRAIEHWAGVLPKALADESF